MIRVLISLVLIAATALVLSFLQSTTPHYAVLTGPLETTGLQKDTIASPTFSVRVAKVLRTEVLSFSKFGRPIERQTEGIWVIVSAELQAKAETMPVRAAAIKGASGRSYQQSHRADGAPQLVTDKTLQPGLSTSGIFVFELPEQETSDMTLVLSKQSWPQLDSEIHIRLDQNGIETREHVEIGDHGF